MPYNTLGMFGLFGMFGEKCDNTSDVFSGTAESVT
jgi:hypothetical protein